MSLNEVIKKLEGDRVIWMVTILLSILSLLAVYSSISTLAYKANGDSFKFLFKHGVMLVLGILVVYAVHLAKLKYIFKLSTAMLYAAGGLLFLTLLIGSNINDASRWLKIPFFNLTFQTSEFAKIALVVYVAKALTVRRTLLHDFTQGIVPILIPIAIICGLILPEDFSTAALLFLVCLLILFIGGVPIRHLLKIIGAGVACLVFIYLIGKAAPGTIGRFDTWVNRIESFANPNDKGNYQIQLSQIAIYNGGVLPHGPGTGTSRNYLPHPYSDMIYAFIIEEYGAILGGFGLLLLYLILLFRTIRMSLKSPKHFGGLMALGLAFMLVIQALVNMGVAVNLFPTTGQPLPLVSMGGTSTIFTLLIIGLILAVSRTVYNPEELQKGESNRVKKTAKGGEYVAA